METNWVDDVINNAVTQEKIQFQIQQLEKRNKFHEIIHAAFVLGESATFFLTRPQPTKENLSWLASAYPRSEIRTGCDQGANYCTITPKF